jgi:hypothetical protein
MGYDLVIGYLTAVKILETFLLVGLKPGRFSVNSIYDSILNPKTWESFIGVNRESF